MHERTFPSFVQGNFAHGNIRFRFEEDFLHLEGQEWAGNVRYRSLPPPMEYTRHTRQPVEAVCFTIFALLLILAFSSHQDPQYGWDGLATVLWTMGVPVVALVAVGALLHWLFKAEYTVVPNQHCSIWVLKDRRHDAILGEIEARRIGGLRKLAAPDPANSPDEERAKLYWLRAQEVITEEEHRLLLENIT